MENNLQLQYQCLKCEHDFSIDVSDEEYRSSLDDPRKDACPRCEQRVGIGPVACRSCGTSFELRFPHWHGMCDLASGQCPSCSARFVSPCIC